MATISLPYTLTAGQPENVNQLNSNLSAITAQVNGNLDASNLATNAVTTAKITDASVTTAKITDASVTPAKLSPGPPSSGLVTASSSFVTNNTHTAISWSSTPSVTVVTGQFVLVDLVVSWQGSGNTQNATLTVGGSEQGGWLIAASFTGTASQIWRLSLAAGTHTLGANAWASSAAGNFDATGTKLRWQVVNA